MAAITDPDQYRYIVEKLAEGESPAGIVSEFCRRWRDTPLDLPDLDAFKRDKLPPAWRDYFDRHRSEFIESAPSRNKDFRIALLDKKAREMAAYGTPDTVKEARALLEQIAKEQADFYAGKTPAASPVTNSEPVAITRTVIDPKQDAEHSDAAGVPAAAAVEPV